VTWENFWWLITVAVVAWYSVVTLYVAFKGATDIKNMLRHLGSLNSSQEE